MSQSDRYYEPHPHFPSGRWEGFYTYYSGVEGEQHRMSCWFDFMQGLVYGAGSDDVGPFDWQGEYCTGSCTCNLVKYYSSHVVHYSGHADENGIWGTWLLSELRGGFHLWPTQEGEEEAGLEVEKLLQTLQLDYRYGCYSLCAKDDREQIVAIYNQAARAGNATAGL